MGTIGTALGVKEAFVRWVQVDDNYGRARITMTSRFLLIGIRDVHIVVTLVDVHRTRLLEFLLQLLPRLSRPPLLRRIAAILFDAIGLLSAMLLDSRASPLSSNSLLFCSHHFRLLLG